MEHSNAEKSHSSDNESVSLSEEDTSDQQGKVVKQLKAKKSKTKEGDKIKKKKVGRLF